MVGEGEESHWMGLRVCGKARTELCNSLVITRDATDVWAYLSPS